MQEIIFDMPSIFVQSPPGRNKYKKSMMEDGERYAKAERICRPHAKTLGRSESDRCIQMTRTT